MEAGPPGGAIIITKRAARERQRDRHHRQLNVHRSGEPLARLPDGIWRRPHRRLTTLISTARMASTPARPQPQDARGDRSSGQMYYQYNPDAPMASPTERTPGSPTRIISPVFFPDRRNLFEQRIDRRRRRQWIGEAFIHTAQEQMDHPPTPVSSVSTRRSPSISREITETS